MSAVISVAMFAHNEEQTLVRAIESVLSAAGGEELAIAVLANGCRDQTVGIAQGLASRYPNIYVEELSLADKANAWNYYVHEISGKPPFGNSRLHVFVDGDIWVAPISLDALLTASRNHPCANAIGALPITGRDQRAWTRRMIANEMLAGGLYALTGSFLERMRKQGVRIPCGLIGEDWAVSLFAKFNLQPLLFAPRKTSHIAFARDAGFSFDSLSLWRQSDYKKYIKRLWRYSLREVQHEMLVGWLLEHHPEELPASVEQLYLLGGLPSRLKWIGPTSFLRTLAVQKIRRSRANANQIT